MMVIGQSIQSVAKAEKEGALSDQCQKSTTFPMLFIQRIENTHLEQSQNLYQSKKKAFQYHWTEQMPETSKMLKVRVNNSEGQKHNLMQQIIRNKLLLQVHLTRHSVLGDLLSRNGVICRSYLLPTLLFHHVGVEGEVVQLGGFSTPTFGHRSAFPTPSFIHAAIASSSTVWSKEREAQLLEVGQTGCHMSLKTHLSGECGRSHQFLDFLGLSSLTVIKRRNKLTIHKYDYKKGKQST